MVVCLSEREEILRGWVKGEASGYIPLPLLSSSQPTCLTLAAGSVKFIPVTGLSAAIFVGSGEDLSPSSSCGGERSLEPRRIKVQDSSLTAH